MSIPENVRTEIKDKLWHEADRLDWANLSASKKSHQYSIWTEIPDLGGRLAAFMDPRQVRVYIKDTLLKAYMRERMADAGRTFRLLGMPAEAPSIESYIKPHGRRLADGRVIAWRTASSWKLTLLAVHERAFEAGGRPHAAVLFEAAGKYSDPTSRAMIEDASKKLELKRLLWVD
jgi:hypothetical protein